MAHRAVKVKFTVRCDLYAYGVLPLREKRDVLEYPCLIEESVLGTAQVVVSQQCGIVHQTVNMQLEYNRPLASSIKCKLRTPRCPHTRRYSFQVFRGLFQHIWN